MHSTLAPSGATVGQVLSTRSNSSASAPSSCSAPSLTILRGETRLPGDGERDGLLGRNGRQGRPTRTLSASGEPTAVTSMLSRTTRSSELSTRRRRRPLTRGQVAGPGVPAEARRLVDADGVAGLAVDAVAAGREAPRPRRAEVPLAAVRGVRLNGAFRGRTARRRAARPQAPGSPGCRRRRRRASGTRRRSRTGSAPAAWCRCKCPDSRPASRRREARSAPRRSAGRTGSTTGRHARRPAAPARRGSDDAGEAGKLGHEVVRGPFGMGARHIPPRWPSRRDR